MDHLNEVLLAIIKNGGGITNIFIIFTLSIFIFSLLIKINPFRNKLDNTSKSISDTIFYSEKENSNDEFKKYVDYINKELKTIQETISSITSENTQEAFEAEIKIYLEENIEHLVNEKLNEKEIFEREIFNNLNKSITQNIDNFLANLGENELRKIYKIQKNNHEKIETSENLFRTIAEERRTAGGLKTFMINLFVVVNIALFALYLIMNSKINKYTALSLSGLYISLVGFIIYIFRTSNARTSVLLAINEDYKKQLSAIEYADTITESRPLSNNDIELIKLLMVNHAERENKTDHPYEVILKGVSGSNIQFKGGKMALGSEKGSTK